MTLTLDEYRAQIIEKLKGCRDPARARDLLAEVDIMLASGRVSGAARQAFWSLSNDLSAATALGAVVAAAQTAIAQYQRWLAAEERT